MDHQPKVNRSMTKKYAKDECIYRACVYHPQRLTHFLLGGEGQSVFVFAKDFLRYAHAWSEWERFDFATDDSTFYWLATRDAVRAMSQGPSSPGARACVHVHGGTLRTFSGSGVFPRQIRCWPHSIWRCKGLQSKPCLRAHILSRRYRAHGRKQVSVRHVLILSSDANQPVEDCAATFQ
jgi:hypothetical protein